MNHHKTIRWLLALFALTTAVALAGLWLTRARPTAQAAQMAPQAPEALFPVLQFSGVTDDGRKGAADRKEATSILCTNTGSANTQIYVELYQWSGAMVYTGTVTAAPKASYTFSTQNTTIYFDDVNLNTDAIFQGYGRVLGSRSSIACTAQVLDPLGYPPKFMDKLTMYNADGTLVGEDRRQFLPAFVRR